MGGVRGTLCVLFKVGADFAPFGGLRGSVVIAHAARLLVLSAEQQTAELHHLKKERQEEKNCYSAFTRTVFSNS